MKIGIDDKIMTVIMLWAALAWSQAPLFHDPEYLYCQGDTLRVDLFSAPAVYDWNGDNKKDLIVGQFINGHIIYFENVGTDSIPVFDQPQFLYADGSIITLPYT